MNIDNTNFTYRKVGFQVLSKLVENKYCKNGNCPHYKDKINLVEDQNYVLKSEENDHHDINNNCNKDYQNCATRYTEITENKDIKNNVDENQNFHNETNKENVPINEKIVTIPPNLNMKNKSEIKKKKKINCCFFKC